MAGYNKKTHTFLDPKNNHLENEVVKGRKLARKKY